MSTDASIDITLTRTDKKNISAMTIIKKLLTHSWTLNDYGKVSYLPIGDNENYSWEQNDIDVKSILKILEEKERLGEVIGINMTWKETNIGGSFLLWNDGTLSINLNINRQIISNDYGYQITDVNWYLTRLLPALNQDGMVIEYFEYSEHV